MHYGASDGEFNFWHSNHTNWFCHQHQEQDTKLSKHIWKLQDKGINFTVKWSVAAYTSTYTCGSRSSDLCLAEKYVIERANHKKKRTEAKEKKTKRTELNKRKETKQSLNKWTELISKYRHRNKYILKNIK